MVFLLKKQIPTLVYCGAGMSRSPAVVAAVLSIVQGGSPDEKLKEIVAGHPHDVSPQLWEAELEAWTATVGHRPAVYPMNETKASLSSMANSLRERLTRAVRLILGVAPCSTTGPGCRTDAPQFARGPFPHGRILAFEQFHKNREALSPSLPASPRPRRHIAEPAKSGIGALADLLVNKDWEVRSAAARAMGQMGPDARAVAPALGALRNCGHWQVRKAAVEALEMIQKPNSENASR